MACGLKLLNNSTSRCESIRKNLPLILLPDKRSLFDVSKKLAVPPVYFFGDDSVSTHYNVLQKGAEIMSKLDNNNILKEERNIFKLIIALNIDEVNIQTPHLFRNQYLFGPSHNDLDNLANSMLFFLITAFTE